MTESILASGAAASEPNLSRSELVHTPTPWKTDPDLGNQCVLGPDGVQTADCSIFVNPKFGKRTDAINEANAAFIVRAVNSHDANEAKIAALVKALEDARRDLLALKSKSDIGSLRNRQIEASAKRIADAIALASSKAVQS